jgi:uncharacterized protein
MKTSLDHLPERKRAQLAAIATIFGDAVPRGLLVLFGSYARGNWVDDPDTGYKSDFDLLAVVHEDALADDVPFWHALEQRFRAIAAPTPVTLIVHTVKKVNQEIRIGQYFFSDIAGEGVALYDRRHVTLARPKALNDRERLSLGEQNFAYWFSSAGEFFRGCRYYAARGQLSHAAFSLHQATERYYHAAALVLSGYKERSHDIEALGKKAAEQHPLLADALPKTEPADKHLFELLKKAYIEARYSQTYRITHAELAILQGRVLDLAARVRAVCLEKLATFCGPDAVCTTLPQPPAAGEAFDVSLPSPPDEPGELTAWARSLSELAEVRMREGEARGKAEGLREGEARGKAEGLREGKEEGLREGEARGEAKGKAEGLREGKAAALLTVLAARGLAVDEATRVRIDACLDVEQLDRWLARALAAPSAREAVDDKGP